MSIKIFLPTELFYAKENWDIYGEIQIDDNAVSYFVIAAAALTSSTSTNCERLRHLGHITSVGDQLQRQQRDVALSFAYDSHTPNIYLNKLSIKPAHAANVNVFLYEASKVLQLHDCAQRPAAANTLPPTAAASAPDNIDGGAGAGGDTASEQYGDMQMLFQLQRKHRKSTQSPAVGYRHTQSRRHICAVLNFPLELVTRLFVLFMEWQPIVLLMRLTVLYEHYQEWRKFRATGKRKANIALDKLLGICLMLLLLFYISHPGDYLIQTSHFIIQKLRLLLHALKGSPIGLKLNVHLNNFFLDCFNYHIDLWATFLDLIEPLVRQLFVPIALLGSMGLSYQLALLADLISVIGLHAHCFYIYTAVLYKVEIKGLQVLWKVVLGKRHNLLKNRVESHNYMNRQLYLATIFFTTLLFLFPTIIVYYIVFTTLRLCIYLANLLLQSVRRRILEFPLQMLCKWLTGNFFEMESLHLQHTPHVPSPLLHPDPEAAQMRMSVFEINVQSSSLVRVFSCESGVLQELTRHEQSVFKRILAGQF